MLLYTKSILFLYFSILLHFRCSTISMESFALGKVCLQLKKIPKKLQKYIKEHYSFIKTFYDENAILIFFKIKNSNEIKKLKIILKKKLI